MITTALSNTFVVERAPDVAEGYVLHQVVAWYSANGVTATPVTSFALDPVKGPYGIQHGVEGFVSFPAARQTFQDVAEFLAFLETNPDIGETMAGAWIAENGSGLEDAAVVGGAGVNPPIVFDSKEFKTNSFWHMAIEKKVFMIEGGKPYPKDKRCVKVKREEFSALKRAGAEQIDPHAAPIEAEGIVEDFDDGGLV